MITRQRPLFLFDGDCGVCQNGTDDMQRRMRPPVDFRAFQGEDLTEMGVSEADVAAGPVLVRVDGSHVIGADAMIEVLRSAGAPYRQMGSVLGLPGLRHGMRALGHVMYRNRHRMPGATAACALPMPSDS